MTCDVVYVRMLPRPVPRVARMIRAAQGKGYKTLYLGSFREQGLARSEIWEGIHTRRIGRYQPSLNGRGFARYLVGVLTFNLALLKNLFKLKPLVVHASDLETFPATFVYCRVRRAGLIYNVHDNYADRYSIPTTFRWVLNVIEGMAVRGSNITLVPEPFRRDALPSWARSKVRIIRNAPEALEQSPPKMAFGTRPIRIAYAGWIDEGRGVRDLVEMADAYPDLIEVLIAGNGDDNLVRLVENSRANYLGYLTHQATLDLFRDSDFVAAIYSPTRPINLMAAPNKVAEALALGRPIITNAEVLMTSASEFDACAVRFPHGELNVAVKELAEIHAKGAIGYADMAESARLAYERLYSWEELKSSVDAAYSEVGLA